MMPQTAIGRFRPENLFRPHSIGVVGEHAGLLANLQAGGFAGPVATARVPASVADWQIVPDLGIVATAPNDAAASLAALGRRGTRMAVVLSMAPDLAAATAASGVRALGPGSFGIAIPALGLNASLAHLPPPAGRLALVSQSAALCRAVLDWAGPNGIGFSHIVGIGGNADLGFAAVLDWLSQDPGTRLILLDIRRIRNRRAFLSAARACARLRPVVAIRAGGRLIDPSGDADGVFAAALHRAGVLTVERLEELLAAAETLARARPVRGDGLVVVTNAIGPGQLAADAALREGVPLVALSPATRGVLQLALPEGARGPGPVYAGVANPLRLAETAAMLAGAPEVGGVLVVHAPTGGEDAAATAALAAGGTALNVPLLVCAMGETTGAAHRERLAAAGVPAFASPEQAVRGFRTLIEQRRARAAARELPPSTVLTLAPDRASVRRLLDRAREAGKILLGEEASLAVLGAYGIPVVPSRAAATVEDAAAAAALLGNPAVLRLCREPGTAARRGIALDLADPDAVRQAALALLVRHRRAGGGAHGGFLVQRQVGRARELRLRVADDPVFGPALGFGLGGAAGVVLRDLAFDLPPLNLPLARALVGRGRAAPMLGAIRDQPAANAEAVAEALVRVSQLVVDFPEIAALDLDPLFADEEGVLAANALLRLRPPGETEMLAIPPYPAELAERVVLGGEALILRPIRPEDAAAHRAFFARLPAEDIRLRFFSSLRALSDEQVARMTQVDYDREMAFIVAREASGETVGVARLVREPGRDAGEFAVIVAPDIKGRGVATRLMRRIIDWGRDQGLAAITGQVLAENQVMLHFVHGLGFRTLAGAEDPSVVEVRLDLTATAAMAG